MKERDIRDYVNDLVETEEHVKKIECVRDILSKA